MLALLGAVVLIAVMVGVYFLVTSVGGVGGAPAAIPAWAGPFVSPQTKAVVYVNIDKFRQSELYAIAQRYMPSLAAMGGMGAGADVTPLFAFLENFTELVVLTAADGKPIGVFQTREDLSLEKLVSMTQGLQPAQGLQPKVPIGIGAKAAATFNPSPPPKPEIGTLGKFPCARSPRGVVVKIGNNTFCGTENEEALKEALGRVDRNEALPLSPELQQALAEARGAHFVAATGLGEAGSRPALAPGVGIPAMNVQPRWVGFGISADSRLSVRGAAGFAGDRDAQDLKKKFDDTLREGEKQIANMPPNMPAEMRDFAKKALSMIQAIRLSAAGTTLGVSGSWRIKDLEDFVKQATGMRGGPP